MLKIYSRTLGSVLSNKETIRHRSLTLTPGNQSMRACKKRLGTKVSKQLSDWNLKFPIYTYRFIVARYINQSAIYALYIIYFLYTRFVANTLYPIHIYVYVVYV